MPLEALYQCKCTPDQKKEITNLVDDLRTGKKLSAEIIISSLKKVSKKTKKGRK